MASPKKTTRKLTGRAKDKFFESGLSAEEAKAVVTSLQVRKDAWPVSRDMGRAFKSAPKRTPEEPSAPVTAKAVPEGLSVTAAEPKTLDAGAAAPFDPFVFGLVPVFKREGGEGLSARLEELKSADELRAMAKAQQIVLPREIRRGEADIEEIRRAILSAVEERVADRKAQI
jgi:hypothetical protein